MLLLVIKYKINVFDVLKSNGYSTYYIRKNKVFTEGQLQCIRNNHLLTHDALDKLCRLTGLQPGDLLEYIPDEQ